MDILITARLIDCSPAEARSSQGMGFQTAQFHKQFSRHPCECVFVSVFVRTEDFWFGPQRSSKWITFTWSSGQRVFCSYSISPFFPVIIYIYKMYRLFYWCRTSLNAFCDQKKNFSYTNQSGLITNMTEISLSVLQETINFCLSVINN